MTDKRDTTGLLHTLHELLLKVSSYDLSRRMRSYRSRPASGVIPDISTSLAKQIDKLAAENHSLAAKKPVRPVEIIPAETETAPIKKRYSPVTRIMDIFDELSRYYKRSAHGNTADQYLGEKLKASTWSHIHTAFMQARLGEVATAKMHADIATQALKEAAHYMSDEEYNKFCLEVEKSLDKLQAMKQ